MPRLNELIEILSEPAVTARYAHAKATKTCKICKGPATRFRNTLSSFEYTISAICQNCQDTYLYGYSPSEEALSST